MSQNRFELDFRIRLKVDLGTPAQSSWITKYIDSDYVYDIFDKISRAKQQDVDDVHGITDLITGRQVVVTNAIQKTREFDDQLHKLIPVFTKKDGITNADWTDLVDFILESRHHFWSSEIPPFRVDNVTIHSAVRVSYDEFREVPIFAVSDYYTCVPLFLLQQLGEHRDFSKWARDVAKKYTGTDEIGQHVALPMTLKNLQDDMHECLSVYIFDILGNLVFRKTAAGSGTIKSIVGRLTTVNGLLHLESVPDTTIVKSVGQTDGLQLTGMQFFDHFTYKVDHAWESAVCKKGGLFNPVMVPYNGGSEFVVYLDGFNMEDIMTELHERFPQHLITKVKMNNKGCITSFVHPVFPNIYYEQGDHYMERQEFYKSIEHLYPRFLQFENKSPNMMASDIHCHLYGGESYQFLYSHLRPEIHSLFLQNNIAELSNCIVDGSSTEQNWDHILQIDIVRCFTSVLYEFEHEWNQFTIFAEMQEYNGTDDILPGEYFLNVHSIRLGHNNDVR
jgi:hypothetical protein